MKGLYTIYYYDVIITGDLRKQFNAGAIENIFALSENDAIEQAKSIIKRDIFEVKRIQIVDTP